MGALGIMEELISSIPIWSLGIVIFFFRVFDVTLGTIRTIAIVEGRLKISMILGFFELLIWVTAISQVLTRIHESFYLAIFYAGGFSVGNAVGMLIEKKLAMGTVVLRIISIKQGQKISQILRDKGQALTTFIGEGLSGPVTLIFIMCLRKKVNGILSEALAVDPKLTYSVEKANAWGPSCKIIPNLTGWRAVLKKK